MNLAIHPPLPVRKHFRIGVLGSGFIVDECHLVAYRKAGFNPVAIASRNPARAVQVAGKHNIPKVHHTYDDLLADPSIEVLDIAVPPNALLELVRKACERKTVKGILAQKPLGMNYAEALAIVSLCETAGITLAINQNMRFDHSVRAAKTLLTNGTIGEPVLATIEMRGIPHWQPWQAELGWATLRIMSIHHLDTFRYWFGEPQRIFCSTRPDPRTKFPHTDGICTYILEYTGGLRCIAIDDTWTGPAKEGCPTDNYIKWRIEGLNGLAIGDIGWCKNPYTTPSTIRYAAKGDQEFHAPTWPESWFPDAFIGTMADLLIALENNSQPTINGRDNLRTMRLVERAYLSAKERQSVSLDVPDCEMETTISPKRDSPKWWNIPGQIKAAMAEAASLHSPPKKEIPSGRTPAAYELLPQENSSLNLFTPRAQQVLAVARKEADRFNHNFVGTEHLLLGIIALGQGTAANVLRKLGLDLETLRLEVEKQIGTGPDQKMIGTIPFTPRVRKVLALAKKEAISLRHTYLGTEHILLGLLREGDGVAARVLTNLNLNIEVVRGKVLEELAPNSGSKPAEPSDKRPVQISRPHERIEGSLMTNFTPRAQQVLSLARREADHLNHNFVGTEHLLLGLIALGQGVSANVLRKLGLDLEIVRAEVEKQIGVGPPTKTLGNIPYTPGVKKVLALAAIQAKNLNHTYVGTEHILLGILEEGDELGARILKSLGVNVEETRIEILKELDPNFGKS